MLITAIGSIDMLLSCTWYWTACNLYHFPIHCTAKSSASKVPSILPICSPWKKESGLHFLWFDLQTKVGLPFPVFQSRHIVPLRPMMCCRVLWICSDGIFSVPSETFSRRAHWIAKFLCATESSSLQFGHLQESLLLAECRATRLQKIQENSTLRGSRTAKSQDLSLDAFFFQLGHTMMNSYHSQCNADHNQKFLFKSGVPPK